VNVDAKSKRGGEKSMKNFISLVTVVVILLLAGGASANSISVTANAALEGSWGLEVDFTGAQSLAYVMSADRGANPHPWSNETGVRIRFIIDPGTPAGSTLSMANQGNVRITELMMDYVTRGVKVVLFVKRNSTGVSWRLQCYVRNGTHGADDFDFGGAGYLTGLTPGWGDQTIVEFEWQAASAPGANDGRVKATRTQLNNPGAVTVTIFEKTNIDNDDHYLNIMWFGAIGRGEVGNPEGYIKLDSVNITRM
jgi:hypothetical protein